MEPEPEAAAGCRVVSDLFLPEASLPQERRAPKPKEEASPFLAEDTSNWRSSGNAAAAPQPAPSPCADAPRPQVCSLMTAAGLGFNVWRQASGSRSPFRFPLSPRHRRCLWVPQRLRSSRPRNSSRPPRPNIYSVGVNHTEQLKALDDARWRIAIALTVAMMVLYFGFILLVAYAKPLLGRIIVPGLSLGILLGALVIIAAWVLIWIYVRWANTHYDAAIDALRDRA